MKLFVIQVGFGLLKMENILWWRTVENGLVWIYIKDKCINVWQNVVNDKFVDMFIDLYSS